MTKGHQRTLPGGVNYFRHTLSLITSNTAGRPFRVFFPFFFNNVKNILLASAFL